MLWVLFVLANTKDIKEFLELPFLQMFLSSLTDLIFKATAVIAHLCCQLICMFETVSGFPKAQILLHDPFCFLCLRLILVKMWHTEPHVVSSLRVEKSSYSQACRPARPRLHGTRHKRSCGRCASSRNSDGCCESESGATHTQTFDSTWHGNRPRV